MPKIVGLVKDIAINPRKVSFLLDPVGDTKPQVRLVLFKDPAGTHTLPQVQLVHRSYMVALLQTAAVHAKFVVVTHDSLSLVEQIQLLSDDLKFDFDFTKDEDEEKDDSLQPKKPDLIEEKIPSPPRPGKRPKKPRPRKRPVK